MHSILSRHNSNAQPTPRKSTSFLSLRREKDRTAASDANAPSAYDTAGPSNTSPSSYFDVYPRSTQGQTTRSVRSRTSRPSTARESPTRDAFSSTLHDPVTIRTENVAKGPTYAFPSVDPFNSLPRPAGPPLANAQYRRTRSRTGPSGTSNWEPTPSVPQLRFSGSSSTQNTETPPRTPVDLTASSDSLDHFPVDVAAPISGVETMDALVDGMNGGDGFSSSMRANRSRFGIPGHHPLYQPPLPTPPPGIVLGGGKTRKFARKTSASDDSSEDEDHSAPSSTSRARRRRLRPSSARTTSNSTITPIASPRHTGDESVVPSSFSRMKGKEVQRPSTAPKQLENRKSLVPSISEIIRNHTPPEVQSRSRPSTIRSSSLYTPSSHGHGILREEVDSEPEPVPHEDGDILSRSSIDSVADEVQRTIRNQSVPRPRPRPPPPPGAASSFIRRHSNLSDNASSIYSPRSDPGAATSLYSISAPSSYIPSSPMDPTFLNISKPSPSQAVAQYLRSPRLTTLLRLTRSPHASPDNPLTVSLSDMGSPTGFPVVVFLGLGCVRHIMGLYDEMAECMGLRLITIDRYVYILSLKLDFHSLTILLTI